MICLFGCGGNRDKTKRPKMAKAAAAYADFLVITSDNPRDEDPNAIIQDILAGLEGSTIPYEVVVDRKEAILRGIRLHSRAMFWYWLEKGMKIIRFFRIMCIFTWMNGKLWKIT